MTAATASVSAANTTTAEAVAGAHALGQRGKGKSSFSDTLDAILSNLGGQTQTSQDQTQTAASPQPSNTVQATSASDNITKHKQTAFAQLKDTLSSAASANDDNASDSSADALSALAAKISGLKDASASAAASTQPASTNAKTGTASANTDSSGTTAATTQTSNAQTQTGHGGNHVSAKHAAITAATQAKLVSALTAAANAPTKIVGSDGKTAASSNSDGTPATTDATTQTSAAQTQTAAETASILAAMQTSQSVVTTVATNADKTAATITSRTMTQLEKAAMSNSAQRALHSAPSAEKTEAQTLSIPAGAKSADGQDSGNAQTSSQQKQSHGSDFARMTADATNTSDSQAQSATVPDAPQSAAPTVQSVTNAAVTDAASVNGSAANTQNGAIQPTTIATTLQVAQQTSTSSSTASPDLAALGASIAGKSKDGQSEFNISMTPAELGRVEVRISVDSAGKAQAHLAADKPETVQMLQRDSQTLERSLKDSGLDLANNGLNFSLKGEQQSSTPTFVARNRALSINSVQTTDTVSSTSSSTSTAAGDSRLDIRV